MTRAAYATSADFRAALLDAELLIPAGPDGLYQRSGEFEDVARGFEAFATSRRLEASMRRFFPPVFDRDDFLLTGYLRSFPDLAGVISVFTGNDREHRALLATLEDDGDWPAHLKPAEVVLASSACHPLYGTLPSQIPAAGLLCELSAFAFRHEPSLDPARMQSFRMLEFITVGTPEQAIAHRDRWKQHGVDILAALGIDVRVEVANDPFFGRVGSMLAANQIEAALKFELVFDLTEEKGTAIASSNYHEDHFGEPFDLRTPDGEHAHSACFGFGLERVTLALFAHYGLHTAAWPSQVREDLGL